MARCIDLRHGDNGCQPLGIVPDCQCRSTDDSDNTLYHREREGTRPRLRVTDCSVNTRHYSVTQE